MTEKNSLVIQSKEHKDGWGIAAYGVEPRPAVAHGVGPAHSDPDFHRVSSLVSSHTVVAHVRLASVGAVELRNSHPFLYGRWSFVHNGTLRNFEQHRHAVESLIRPDLRANIHGATDSERCFHIFLTRLAARTPLDATVSVEVVARALAETMELVSAITDTPRGPERSSMNFLVTNGDVMVASRRNRTLFISDGSRSASHQAAALLQHGARLNQIIIASEALCGNHTAWSEVAEDEVVGVDGKLVLHRWRISDLTEPVSGHPGGEQLRRSLPQRLGV